MWTKWIIYVLSVTSVAFFALLFYSTGIDLYNHLDEKAQEIVRVCSIFNALVGILIGMLIGKFQDIGNGMLNSIFISIFNAIFWGIMVSLLNNNTSHIALGSITSFISFLITCFAFLFLTYLIKKTNFVNMTE